MNQGQLVEQGTHETLLQQGGLYKQLVDLQQRERQPESMPAPQRFMVQPSTARSTGLLFHATRDITRPAWRTTGTYCSSLCNKSC